MDNSGQYHYISLSPDGLKLATGGWHDTVVRIWDALTGAPVKTLAEPEWGFDSSPWPMFERNGRSLIIACLENCRVWDTNSWTAGPRLPGAELPVVVSLSHRGALAAIGQGQTSIQLRDIRTGEVLATLQSPIGDQLAEVAISPDNTQIAVTHWGTRELLVWDLRLLREELAKMGLDWNRPPFPPVVDKTQFTRINVLGEEPPLASEPAVPVK